ncbi:MAG: hypothetical protein IKC11_03700 [Clostridia bacterium]|nr:hypothetical protein [Clostridia bacterium]
MKDNIEQIEDAVYKPGKRSVVTGEKIKHKSVRRIKKEHKERAKEDRKEQKILDKKIEKMDRKFKKTQVTVESTTISQNDADEGFLKEGINNEAVSDGVEVKNSAQEKILIVRRVEKGGPVTLKRKVLNVISFFLVGIVAVVFGYMAGNFYIANVLNKVDYGAFKEAELRQDGQLMYNTIKTSGRAIDQFSAVELFVGAEYMLGTQVNYYADIEGSIQPSIGSTQVIWGYKSKQDNIYDCEQVSKGMVSVAERYTWDVSTQTANIYKASKIATNKAEYPSDPTWVMDLDEYRDEYGTAPDSPCVPYIVSNKTYLEGTDKVTKLKDGTYQLTFQLKTDASVINYIKQMKHMAGLPDYPNFKSIYVTAIIDSDLKLTYLRYDESYNVMYFGVMASCSGFVQYDFSY